MFEIVQNKLGGGRNQTKHVNQLTFIRSYKSSHHGFNQLNRSTESSCPLTMLCAGAKSLQSCLTLCDSMDCSPTGSSDHGILLARILEWVAVFSSSRFSRPRDWTQADFPDPGIEPRDWTPADFPNPGIEPRDSNPTKGLNPLRLGFNPWSGISAGEEHGNPLQYSCQENPMVRGACWAIVHRVTKSQTRLKWLGPAHSMVRGQQTVLPSESLHLWSDDKTKTGNT